MASTATAAMTASTSTSTADPMAGMGHGMGGPNACQISMLWNWNVKNACFISKSWRITSNGMFAGSCIGVILLVISLELLRRAGKEYDRYILAQYARSAVALPSTASSTHDNTTAAAKSASTTSSPACVPAVSSQTFRPNVLQQAVRALLHMLQFAVAYFIMLLAMYYNGYILICIFIGAYIGYFIFGWESFKVGGGARDRLEENATVCCG
ncbi:Ctr-domain-containing protein [Aaosphaeria arxii CBS 175.79]|uniref:Copper transport protein n=1 Tax=Aaosphaeria arxii CBS 175.79 TaxID=1450172 RepID=A0A6A5X659_9PLEO|nr:Ctr-domain-containing protein [Aaosphaeria arxii CBS 175.79]KAF2008495.1 Ctr-domain-containing protein [Aaosphaeria arxii CBS 175.79]